MRKIQTGLFLVFILVLGACTRSGDDSARLQIQLPSTGAPSHLILASSVSAQSAGGGWASSITAASEINCYIVMVGGENDTNWCNDRSGTRMMNFGPYAGGVPAGQSIDFSLKSNQTRTFYLLGSRAQNGACRSFQGSGPDRSNLSYFRLLDTQAVTLKGGEQKISMRVPSSLSSLPEMDECQVRDIAGGGGSSGINLAELFGNGRDGSVGWSGTNNYIASSTYSGMAIASSLAPSKKFSSSRYVVSMGSWSELTLDSAVTSDDFEAGDEIIWSVVAGYKPAAAPDEACNGGIFRGQWGTAKVSSVISGLTLQLDRPLTNNPAPLPTAAALAGVVDQSVQVCRIFVARVPSFESVSVTSSAVLQLSPAALDANYSSGGGFLAVRIRNLALTGASSTLRVEASAAGYPGGTNKKGGSPYGYVSTGGISPNETGGGLASSGGGGGGGNQGSGGDSASSNAQGGQISQWCSGPCTAWEWKKAIMGGAGGGNASVSGTAGGGAVFLFVQNLTGDGILEVQANGADAPTSYSGAGAGGSSLLMIQNSSSFSGQINIAAKGGAAISVNTWGGSGGGGAVEYLNCGSTGATVLVNGGASNGGSAGAVGASIVRTNYAPLCP